MANSIDAYSSSLSNVQELYEKAKNSSALENSLKTTDYSKATDEELMAACKSFESYFLEQIFKSMDKTIMKSESEDTTAQAYRDMFGDNLIKEYAEKAANSNDGKGFGLAQMLYEQMKRNYGLE